MPGRPYYVYAEVGHQGAVNITTIFQTVVYTGVYRKSDGEKTFVLQPFRPFHFAIEFDGSDPASSYEISSTRALIEDEYISFSFGYVAWGERGGQGGGVLYSGSRSFSRNMDDCSLDSLRRTYLFLMYRPPGDVREIISWTTSPAIGVTLRASSVSGAPLPDISAGQLMSVEQRYSTGLWHMTDFATAVLAQSHFVFDFSQKSNGYLYVGPTTKTCSQDVYVASTALTRPACEFIGADGALDARVRLYDSGNVTYSRTNGVQFTSTVGSTQVNATVGRPVTLRGPNAASSYPVVFRIKALSVSAGSGFYIYHWKSRSCGPSFDSKVASLTSVNQVVEITLNCPAQAIYYNTNNGNTSLEVQLLSINSFVPSTLAISPGQSLSYTARPQEAFEYVLAETPSSPFRSFKFSFRVLLDFAASSPTFSIVISGDASWTTGAGGVHIFRGSCGTRYSALATGRNYNSTHARVHTFVADVASEEAFSAATLQVRSTSTVAVNLTITVVAVGDTVCATGAGVPPACSPFVDYPVPTIVDFYDPAVAANGVQQTKDWFASSYPYEFGNNTVFYQNSLRQACLRFVPKCSTAGILAAQYSCRRDCYMSLSGSTSPTIAQAVCSTLDKDCSPYAFPVVADPPIPAPVQPPQAPPVQAPEAEPVAAPVKPPVAAPVASQAPVAAPSQTVAPTASQAPQADSAPVRAPSTVLAPSGSSNASSAGTIKVSLLIAFIGLAVALIL